ncbi:MAG: hypothetical protein ACOX7X_03695 [Methanosarcina flavescens]|nr:hypothetical protein [Methanosarcina flavescens]
MSGCNSRVPLREHDPNPVSRGWCLFHKPSSNRLERKFFEKDI